MIECNVFLDTCCLIYALENGNEIGNKARNLIQRYIANAQSIYISPVSIMEFTAHDHTNNKRRIKSFIEDYNINIIPIDEDMGYYAGEMRCGTSLHSMDSLQLAAAELLGPIEFVTNDLKLKQFGSDFMKITIIEES